MFVGPNTYSQGIWKTRDTKSFVSFHFKAFWISQLGFSCHHLLFSWQAGLDFATGLDYHLKCRNRCKGTLTLTINPITPLKSNIPAPSKWRPLVSEKLDLQVPSNKGVLRINVLATLHIDDMGWMWYVWMKIYHHLSPRYRYDISMYHPTPIHQQSSADNTWGHSSHFFSVKQALTRPGKKTNWCMT